MLSPLPLLLKQNTCLHCTRDTRTRHWLLHHHDICRRHSPCMQKHPTNQNTCPHHTTCTLWRQLCQNTCLQNSSSMLTVMKRLL